MLNEIGWVLNDIENTIIDFVEWMYYIITENTIIDFVE